MKIRGDYEFGSTKQMAWERRKNTTQRYYYRSHRLPDGQVVKTYYGAGLIGAVAAETDRLTQAEQVNLLHRHRALLDHIQQIASPLVELSEACDVMTEATLLAAGYHNHRGEWRKVRHGRNNAGT